MGHRTRCPHIVVGGVVVAVPVPAEMHVSNVALQP